VTIPKGLRVRRLHKAFLRYHDPKNWPLLREALKRMGRADLIGNGKRHLVPSWQPRGGTLESPRQQHFRTQHTGLPADPPRSSRSPKGKRPTARGRRARPIGR
jgi:hypothetical protein